MVTAAWQGGPIPAIAWIANDETTLHIAEMLNIKRQCGGAAMSSFIAHMIAGSSDGRTTPTCSLEDWAKAGKEVAS